MLLVLLSLLLVPLAADETDRSTTVDKTVRIYVYINEDNRPDRYGSGIIVAPNQVLTAHHVIRSRREDDAITIRMPNGRRIEASVIYSNSEWDVALLHLNQPVLIQPITLGDRPTPSSITTVHGLGSDYEYRSETGRVLPQFYKPNKCSQDRDLFHIVSVSARPGDSGGPVTDTHGNLVGLILSVNFLKHYTRCVSIDRIEEVFKLHLDHNVLRSH